MIVSPVTYVVVYVEYKYDIKRAYWITGGTK